MSTNCTKDLEITIGGSLVAYWKFDEAAGTTRADSTPNNNTLSQVLGTIASTAGVISNAVRLTAVPTAPLISGVVSPTWNGQDITIAGWVRDAGYFFSTISNSTHYYFSGAVGLEWALGLEAFNSNEYQVFFLDEFGVFTFVNSGVISAGDVYHFIVLQLNMATLRIGISVNNSAMVTGAITGAPPSVPASNGWQSRNQDATPGASWDFDEMGIWYRLLEPFEISSLYNGGAGTTYPAVPT